jgi:elongation factor Ts
MTTTTLIKQLREATFASYLDCRQALEDQRGDFDKALEQLRAANLDKAEQKTERETREGLVVVARSDDAACAVELNCETDFVALTQEFKHFAHCLADRIVADAALTDLDRVLAADFAGTSGQAAPSSIALAVRELAGKMGENIAIRRVARYQVGPAGVVEAYIHVGALEGYGPQEGRLGVLVELGLEDPAVVPTAAVRALAHDLALHIASAGPRYVSPAVIPAAELAEQRVQFEAQLAAEHKPEALQARILEGRLNKFYETTCLLNQPYLKDESLRVADLLRQAGAALGTPVRVVRFARFELGD